MMRTYSSEFSIKAVSESGRIQGHGSVFGNVDSYRESVMPGAFAKTLATWKEKGRMPAMLWQHRSSEPVGVWDAMREDDRGLVVEGRFAMKTQAGREAYELAAMNAVSGLSIGFRGAAEEVDKESGVTKLTDIDLMEVSLVTFPANEDARIGSVKSVRDMSLREFEAFLREKGGLSWRESARIGAKAYEVIHVRDEQEPDELTRAIGSLTSILNGVSK